MRTHYSHATEYEVIEGKTYARAITSRLLILSALVVYVTIRVTRLLPLVKNPGLSKLAATCPKADHRAAT